MLLPGGVTKATGLDAALAAFGLSPRNTIGIGDAENDHAFVAYCECAVAVADAVPALRERADLVTTGPSARGVVELIQTHVLTDAVDLFPRLTRHWITLGEGAERRAGRDPGPRRAAARRRVLGLRAVLADRVAGGPSGRGGPGRLCPRPGRQLPGAGRARWVVVLGGKAERALPTAEELAQLLCHPRTSLVLDLSAGRLRKRRATRRKPSP